MGYGDIGPFGATLSDTPNLDRLAAEGLTMTNFYVSATACTPSRAALVTGSYADRIDMDRSVVFPADKRGLNPSEVTIADMLKADGYATACIGKWHLGDAPEFMPGKQGFDTYTGIPYSNDMWSGHKSHPPLPFIQDHEAVAHISEGLDQALLGDALSAAAVKFITESKDEPFFLYFPHSMVHVPRYVLQERVDKIEGDFEPVELALKIQIEEIDASVGRVMETLESLGLAENTLIFFTSDNGGSGATSMGGLRGGKGGSKYEGHMRAGTVAKWPAKIPAGTVTGELASTIDLLPTIASISGAKVPGDRVIDGKDISSVLTKPGAKSPHPRMFYEYEGVREGDWKLVIPKPQKNQKAPAAELFDLSADGGEQKNIAGKHPEKVKEFLALLAAHRESIQSQQRMAGYVDDPKPIATEGLPSLAALLGREGEPVMIEGALGGHSNMVKRNAPAKKPTSTIPVRKPGPKLPHRVDVAPAKYQPAINDILITDFEGEGYGDWKVVGEAFGDRPSNPDTHTKRISGFLGQGFVNSFRNGDKSTGELPSPPFVIERKHINFLIGGGKHLGQTGIQLVVNGKVVRAAAGLNLKNPRNEDILDWQSMDVAEFIGQEAVLKIVDQHEGGWGHTVVDHIFQSDQPMPSSIPTALNRNPQPKPASKVTKSSANFVPPPKPGVELDDEWSTFLLYDQVGYDQSLRPQFHFTSRMGWLNDPNGMVYYDGEWLMYFQHNPVLNDTGIKAWGAAVSPDLMRWKQMPHAIKPYPNVMRKDGPVHSIWSGSAVVDVNNALGKQQGDVKTLFGLYTATHRNADDVNAFFQGGVYSTDRGRTWTKIDGGRPIIEHLEGYSPGQRDPRIIYYEPGDYYITIMMIGGPDRKVRLWKSTDLLTWEAFLDIPNKAAECIDLYSVAVDGDPENRKWVIADANTHYEVGDFDGETWTGFGAEDESGKRHRFDYGDSWYAAQAFNQAPEGRVVHVGWLRCKQAGFRPFHEAGMPFSQQMSIPIEITLRTTAEGIRLFRNPVKEIGTLYQTTKTLENLTASEANAKLVDFQPELVDLTLKAAADEDFTLSVRGLEIQFDAAAGEFVFTNSERVSGEKAAWKKKGTYSDDGIRRMPAPPIEGQVTVRALVDRASLELFVNNGEAAASFVVVPDPENRRIEIEGSDKLKIKTLVVNELKSIWY